MIIITKKNTDNQGGWHMYQLAGQKVLCQFEIPGLDAFKLNGMCELAALPESNIGQSFSDARLNYEGLAPFEHQMQKVECWAKGSVVQLLVSGRAICQIDLENDHISILDDDLVDSQLALEVITGPAIVLLLAKKGLFCLHASAASVSGTNVAFIAESGTGKSTLSKSSEDWLQLSDDILPIGYSDKGVRGLVDFPQLKLPNAAVEVLDLKKNRFEIDTIFRLSESLSDEIVFTELNPQQAMLQLIRHTVAAKLFDISQLQSHMSFAKKLASKVSIFELAYPRNLNDLPQLKDTIDVFLSTRQ